MAQKGILKKTMAVTLAMTMCWAALSVQGFAAKTPADEDAAAINLVETDTSSGDDIVIDIPKKTLQGFLWQKAKTRCPENSPPLRSRCACVERVGSLESPFP